jgi:site-specific DNA-methyltransferase (adenine-specific)
MIMTPITKISPYAKNAKKHPEKQIKQIANSIEAFGFNQPIVVDKDNVIIVGHGRYEAARTLGLQEVPVITVDLTEEQANAYRLADNKLNESEWDMNLVIEELKGLSEDMIELTGFDQDLIIEDDDKDDLAPEIPAESRSQIGDIYTLGSHRVMCGDSTKREDVDTLMSGVKADMIFTDPPYNINYKGQGKDTSNHIMMDNLDTSEFDTFLDQTFARYSENAKAGAGVYVFHASRTQGQFEIAMRKNGYEIKNQLIWNKPMAALGWGDYRWKHEPFFYAGKIGTPIQFYGDRTHSTVWDFQKTEQELLTWAKKQKRLESQGKATIWSMKRDSVQEYVHPTQKPVELIQYAITNSTKAGDVIMDLFGGSGSTMIAAEKMGRTAHLMELDPKYVDVIIERYCQYTGNRSIIKNGKEITWEPPKT